MRLEFTITHGQQPERIDIYLSHSIENVSRTKIQKAIDADSVWVNGKTTKASYLVQPGDVIAIEFPRTPKQDAIPEDIPLDIVYEDDDLLIVNKPPGMSVHPGHGIYSGTLVNALLYHCNVLANASDPIRPGIVHRIDKDTSGLLVAAKNDHAHRFLARQFMKKTTLREYWAIAWGIMKKPSGLLEGNIGRDPRDRKKFCVIKTGKPAVTEYEVIEEFEFLSLLKLHLQTGRTHQIRVHLSTINHPIFGDATYGGRNIVYGGNASKYRQHVENLLEIMPRQALHAKTLGFVHPTTKEKVFFNSELPADMKKLIKQLKKP
jgi:23S rRNA pseudouridine1911/1915/1917 synthase